MCQTEIPFMVMIFAWQRAAYSVSSPRTKSGSGRPWRSMFSTGTQQNHQPA